MKFLMALFVVLLLSAHAAVAQTQYFGQNKIQYENFDWRYIQSEHFDVYFYEGGYDIARFTAEEAESAYVKIKNDPRITPLGSFLRKTKLDPWMIEVLNFLRLLTVQWYQQTR